MAVKGEIKFQIGKNGVTSGVIESLNLAFKTRKTIRINLLKSAERDRGKIKETAKEIVDGLKGNYKCKIIGFTIILRKAGVKK